MLVILGFLMVATFMALIMTKRLTPLLALIIVPTVFGLFAGAGLGIGDMVMDAVKDMSSTAALLMFAIIYFGLMIDVGLFDKLVTLIVRIAGHDPAKVVVGTMILTALISLDGDGSTTFIVVTAALLPVYQRLGLSPVVLTCVAGLTNGTLNIVPWGGPTARAAAALKVDASEIFVPMLPSLGIGLLVVFLFAVLMGRSERRRLAVSDPERWGRGTTDSSRGGPACFEIDGFDAEHRGGWSVIVRGHLHEVTVHDQPALDRFSNRVDPWVGERAHLLRLDSWTITGRRLRRRLRSARQAGLGVAQSRPVFNPGRSIEKEGFTWEAY